jgi:four helix bundle protein
MENEMTVYDSDFDIEMVMDEGESYGNAILDKSLNFAVRIVKFYKIKIKNNFEMQSVFKQLLRSGTSIGANVSEAQDAESKNDFIHKLTIALKEARETEYWLLILNQSEIISEREFKSLQTDCIELIKILISIIKKSKNLT